MSAEEGGPAPAADGGAKNTPASIVFACNLNSIRSPMAAGLAKRRLGAGVRVTSCGVYPGGYLDPLMVQVMDERGVVMDEHTPKTFEELSEPFALVVALTALSRDRAQELAAQRRWRVEYWPSPDPSGGDMLSREGRLQAYRDVRDELDRLIRERFLDETGPVSRAASTRSG